MSIVHTHRHVYMGVMKSSFMSHKVRDCHSNCVRFGSTEHSMWLSPGADHTCDMRGVNLPRRLIIAANSVRPAKNRVCHMSKLLCNSTLIFK